MAHAFIDEDTFVPARRAVHAEHPNLQWALIDLENEGLDALDEIAAEYGLNPSYLIGRWARRNSI